MAKSIFKECIIFLLLLVVIALILGILFYNYIPSNKTVPVALKQYELSEDAQEELKETMSQSSENIVKTYSIGDTDLSVYENSKDYNKGKVNPFEDYTTGTISSTQNGNTTDKNNTNTTNNNVTSNNIDSRNNEIFFTGGKNQ